MDHMNLFNSFSPNFTIIEICNKYCIQLNFIIQDDNEIIKLAKMSNNYWKDIDKFKIISYIKIIDHLFIQFRKYKIHRYITDMLRLTDSDHNGYKYLDLEGKIEERLNINVGIFFSKFENNTFCDMIKRFYDHNFHNNIDLIYYESKKQSMTIDKFIDIIRLIIQVFGNEYNDLTIKEASFIIYNKMLSNEKLISLAILEIFLLGTFDEPLCKIIDENFINETLSFNQITNNYKNELSKVKINDNIIGYGIHGCVIKKDNFAYKYGFSSILDEYNNILILPKNGPYNYENITFELINNHDNIYLECFNLNKIKLKDEYIELLKDINDNNKERIDIINSYKNINRNNIYVLKTPYIEGETLYKYLLKFNINIKSEKRFIFPTDNIYIDIKDWHKILIKLIILYYKVKKLNKLDIYHNDIHCGNILYDSKNNTLKLIDFAIMSNEIINNKYNDLKRIINIIKYVISYGIFNKKIYNILIKQKIINYHDNFYFLKDDEDLIFSLLFLKIYYI